MKFLILGSCFLLMLVVVQAQDAPCYPCDPAWPREIYYPNFEDCGTIWQCKGGNLTLTACNPPQVFEFLLQACVPDDDTMLFTCKKLLHRQCTISG